MPLLMFYKYFTPKVKADGTKHLESHTNTENVVITPYPSFAPNPKYPSYHRYCKYSLISLKTFSNDIKSIFT